MSLFVGALAGVFQALFQLSWIWLLALALELAVPRGRRIAWRAQLKPMVLGVVYWTITGASGALIGMALQRIGVHPLLALHPAPKSVGAWLLYAGAGTLLSLLTWDFGYYWYHRLQHQVPMMWRYHAVHHAIENTSAINSYPHWLEEICRLPIMTLPLALFVPVGLPVISWYGWMAFHSVYLHSQTRLHFGPLWRVCMDNRFHRLHHSREAHHFDKNFGLTTPLWDWMFGTLYVPAKGEWPQTGLAEALEVDGLADFLWRPFRPAPGQGQASLAPVQADNRAIDEVAAG